LLTHLSKERFKCVLRILSQRLIRTTTSFMRLPNSLPIVLSSAINWLLYSLQLVIPPPLPCLGCSTRFPSDQTLSRGSALKSWRLSDLLKCRLMLNSRISSTSCTSSTKPSGKYTQNSLLINSLTIFLDSTLLSPSMCALPSKIQPCPVAEVITALSQLQS